MLNFFFIRVLSLLNFFLGFVFLYYASLTTDSCYTDPCLSTDYEVNILRVSVSTSVASVVSGGLFVVTPVFTLYLLYTRCRAFSGGVLNGTTMLVTMIAWLQAISWGDQFSVLSTLTEGEILIFGSGYTLNTTLRRSTEIMTILCSLIGVLSSIVCLLLLCMRHQYCVDYHPYSRTHSMLRPYQAVALSDPSHSDGISGQISDASF